MGEAKLKEAARQKSFVAELDRMLAMPTALESETLKEVLGLPVQGCRRQSKEVIAYMRTRARYCHDNVDWYVAADPGKASSPVRGWVVTSDALVLHSVVRVGGELWCVTPPEFDAPDDFDFIEDPVLVVERREDKYHFARNGVDLPFFLLRPNPSDLERRAVNAKAALARGVRLNVVLGEFLAGAHPL